MPGHHADFVLIDVDPLLASPAELRKAVVKETWVGGRPAYRNPAFNAAATENRRDGETR
jgi:predicted amidohydrolase YtcJ